VSEARPDSGRRVNLLRTIQLIYGAFWAFIVLLFVVAAFIAPGTRKHPVGGLGVAICVVGVAAVAAAWWLRSRPLVGASRATVAASYRATFFFGLAVSEWPALLGLIAVFRTGLLWPYLLGFAFSAAGFWLTAPTPAAVLRRDRSLRRSGSPHTLSASLQGVEQLPRRR
jgi:hypothetical protein